MLKRIKQAITARLATTSSAAASGRRVVARWDAAQTTSSNAKHWAMADHLSADAATSPDVRATLRARSRYEAANNSYARGIVDTLANYVVGTGPRLQVQLEDDPDGEAARRIERSFARWAESIDLAEKLRSMRVAQAESGEVFGVMLTNPRLDGVQLDLRLIEADQITSPAAAVQVDPRLVDGVVHDDQGNPRLYHVLKHHPGDARGAGGFGEFDELPAEQVLHLYRPVRPGQSRGVPDLTPALPLFALLRRYTLAVCGSAEQAALVGGVIYTDMPAGGEADDVEPLDQVELERNEWWTMPKGYKALQIKAEQPTTQYGEFHRQVLNEIARCLNMPFNIAAGNSSDYNYASGRLDHQTFFKSLKIDQQRLVRVVLDPLFRAWLSEASLVEGLLPQQLRTPEAARGVVHQWFWPGLEHVDPIKEATAQEKRLAANTTTLAEEYARQGMDWEEQLRQRARERRLIAELAIDNEPAAAQPAGVADDQDAPDAPDAPDDEELDDD